jgi:modulator of FtsH protease HflK
MRRSALLSLVPIGAALLWALTGWCVVRPGEQVVVRRFGRVVEPAWGPGFHWGFPLGVDRFDRVRTDQVRRVNIGPADALDAGAEPSGGEFLTGDLNLVRIQAIVQYRVDNTVDYVVQSESTEALLRRLAEAGLSACLARRGIDPVLRAERQLIAGEVENMLRQAVERRRLGMSILGVSLTDARPPGEVADDFVAAQSAESRRDRRGNEARTQAETTSTAARAESQARLEQARSASHRKLVASRAQAQRFLALVAEAQRSRSLTIQRIYLDAMKSLLNQVRRKVVLPPGDAVDLTVLGVED